MWDEERSERELQNLANVAEGRKVSMRRGFATGEASPLAHHLLQPIHFTTQLVL